MEECSHTRKEQDNLFMMHGIHWSGLWHLPYWDPPRMLVVDLMHCLLEGLSQFHFQEVLKLTNAAVECKPKVVMISHCLPLLKE